MVDELADFHAERRLFLAAAVGGPAFAHMDREPHVLVDELLALARLGALTREVAANRPTTYVGSLVGPASEDREGQS